MKDYKDKLHVPSAELVVTHDGKEMHLINKKLLDQQMCWNNLDKIKKLHEERYLLYDAMRQEDDPKLLRELDAECQELEYELQELWNFGKDSKFVKFWIRPKCECPKMDNEDAYPYGHYIISGNCPLHAWGLDGKRHT